MTEPAQQHLVDLIERRNSAARKARELYAQAADLYREVEEMDAQIMFEDARSVVDDDR